MEVANVKRVSEIEQNNETVIVPVACDSDWDSYPDYACVKTTWLKKLRDNYLPFLAQQQSIDDGVTSISFGGEPEALYLLSSFASIEEAEDEMAESDDDSVCYKLYNNELMQASEEPGLASENTWIHDRTTLNIRGDVQVTFIGKHSGEHLFYRLAKEDY